MKRLDGKVAIVTGSGQGVGKPIAIALAKEGAKVVTNNRRPGSTSASTYGDSFINSLPDAEREWMKNMDAQMRGDAETTAREIIAAGGEAVPFFGDISQFDVAGELVKTAVDNFGKVDILVNTAGTFAHFYIWEMPETEWDRVSDVSLKGTFNTVRHAVPYMKEQGWGRIINTTSGAWRGVLEHSNYGAAKAGVVGFTRSVAKDVYPYGITCNAFGPTAMTRSVYNLVARGRATAKTEEPLLPQEVLNLFETVTGPEPIAPFIVYLATNEAAYITGTTFACRGSRIGLYSEPQIANVIEKKDGSWELDELIRTVPKELLKDYQNIVEQPRRFL